MKDDQTQLTSGERLLSNEAMVLEGYLGESLIEVRVVDGLRQPVASGDIGRLLVRGPGLNLLGDMKEGGEALPGGWIDIGERGYIGEAGRAHVLPSALSAARRERRASR